jgi:REP element-mobilizing transposase RayT
MAQTFTNLLTHVIFSTKDWQPLIEKAFRADLHAYLGGIVREMGGTALMIGGTVDHVHLPIDVPPTISIAAAMRVIKTNSSRWLNETHTRNFNWQAGYGAFTVSQSNAAAVTRYISGQEMHHRTRTFQEEFVSFLKRHGISYDERFIWK